MASDLELRALLKIDADTSGADKARAALRGVQAEAAQVQKAAIVDKQGDAALTFLRQHPTATGGQLLTPAGTKLPQSTLDAIRGTLAAGGSRKDAEAALLALGADAATIAAVTGTGNAGAPVRAAAVPGAHPAAPAAPRGPGGTSLKETADDAEKAGKSFHLTDNEAVRFGASLVGLGIGISAFSFAGRILHDTLREIVTVGIEAERQARVTGVAFGQEAAGLTAFAQSVRESSGFTREAILGAAGGVQSLVSTGKITQAQLEGVVKVGTQYAQITGQDVAKTTAALADAIAHGGDAAGIFGGKLSDVSVAANYANGAFATTFKSLSEVEQAQIRFAYAMQLGTKNTQAASDELKSLSGQLRVADTAMHDAAVAAASWGLAQGAVDLYVDSLKEAARWAKLGLAAGDPSHDPVLAALLGAGAARTNAQDTDAAYAQARDEILSMAGVTDQLTTAQGRLTVSTEIQARAEELLRQKRQATITPPPAGIGPEDYNQAGGPWTVTRPGLGAPTPPAAPPAQPSPNPYPQMLDQAQERGRRLAYAVTVAQRESLGLLGQINTAEQALLGPKRDLLDIEYQINRATDVRLGLIDQERVLRAQVAAQGRQDALQDAQTQEQRLGLLASIRGPGRGAARAELRRFDRAQTVQRAQLAALDAERPVTLAQRTARDDAASQQLALLPLQQTAATIQRGVDARQHDLDLLTQIREGDKLHADEIVLQLTAQQQANAETAESYRQLIKARDDYFTFGPGKAVPGQVAPPVSFSVAPGPAGPGGAFVINIQQTITGDVSGADTALLRQVADDSGTASANGVLAAWRQAQQGAAMPSRSTEAGAR